MDRQEEGRLRVGPDPGKATAADAARQHGLTVVELEQWKDAFPPRARKPYAATREIGRLIGRPRSSA